MAKKNNKENATATESAEPKAEKAKAGTSLSARTRAAFLAVMTALSDAAETVMELGVIDEQTFNDALALQGELASKSTRGVPASERLAQVETAIQNIYIEAQTDIGALTRNQDKLQALFVKKQNLERRITTEKNKEKAEAANG